MEATIFLNEKPLLSVPVEFSISDVLNEITKRTALNSNDFYLIQNGKIISNPRSVVSSNVHAFLRQFGGKGGFGSMLRAIGAQIEKTTNREACRDLSGRRLRDINEEKRLKAWLEKQKDKEAEAEEKRKRKLQKLMAVPKHEFKDSEYETARSELTEKVSEAVEEGFKKAVLKPADPIALKRKAVDKGAQKSKKAALWIDDDLDGDTTSSDDSANSDIEGESSKSKMKSSKANTSSTSTHSNDISSDSDLSRPSEKNTDVEDNPKPKAQIESVNG